MEDEQHRTIWCGNLNEKVTEDLLYELFLQGGPVEKISIPKDRNGKQRTFAFITYKHKCSVLYALELFDGTTLFNRSLSLKLRETVPVQQDPQNQFTNQQQALQYANQMLLNNFLPNMGLPNMNMYNMYPNNAFMMPNQSTGYYQQNMQQNMQQNFQNEDRRSNRPHPYYGNNRKERDHDNRDRSRNNRDRDNNRSRDNRDWDNNKHIDNLDNDQDSRYNVKSHRSKHVARNSNTYNSRRNYR